MTRIDTTKGSGGKAFDLLETDVYRMEIKRASIEPNKFSEPDENGNLKDQLVLVWEVYEATDEQDDAVVGLSVWQRMTPWYGSGKRGDSQFKLLIDSLVEQGVLGEFNLDDFETDLLVGVKQRINVEKYAKGMGQYKGEPGNHIVGKPMPLSRKKVQAVKPAKNVPVAAGVDDEDDMPF